VVQDEEAVFGRRSIAPRNAVKTPGAVTAFRVGSDEERESLPSTRGAKRGQNRGRRCAEERRSLSEGSRADRVAGERTSEAKWPQGAAPSGPKQVEASCAGLRTEDVYAYVERAHGRANRPTCNGSTVAPYSDRTLTSTARHGERGMGTGKRGTGEGGCTCDRII